MLKLLPLALLLPAAALSQSATPVPALDLKQLTGTWYQVARYPNKSEKKCTSGALVLYSLGDKPGRFQQVISCQIKGGYTDTYNKDGKRAKHATDGQLKIIYLYFLGSKFWVLAYALDNSWLVTGTPNHKSLSILARTKTLPAETLASIEQQLTTQGFQTSKMQSVSQPR